MADSGLKFSATRTEPLQKRNATDIDAGIKMRKHNSAPSQVLSRKDVRDQSMCWKFNSAFARMDSVTGNSAGKVFMSMASRLTTAPKKTLLLDRIHSIHEEKEELLDETGLELQTNGEATMNLLNNCLGSGMVSIGFTFSEAGILFAPLLMIASALLNTYTTILNIRSGRILECDAATAEIGEKTFGILGRYAFILCYLCTSFFCMVSYTDATADAVSGLLALFLDEGQLPSRTTITVACWLFLLLPPTLLRSLKSVAVASFVAFLGACGLLITVVADCTLLILRSEVPDLSQVKLFPSDFAGALNAAPILLLIFAIQSGGTLILTTMKDTSERNQKHVCAVGLSIVASMDSVIGFVCYFTFLSQVKGDVLQSFGTHDPIAVVARVSLLVLVVLSYMFMSIPCKVTLVDLVFQKNEAIQEASWAEFYFTTLVLNVAALGVALCVTDLSLVLGLCGAVCGPFISFLFPCACYMKANAMVVEGAPPVFSLRNTPYFLVMFLGVCILFLCTNQIISRIIS